MDHDLKGDGRYGEADKSYEARIFYIDRRDESRFQKSNWKGPIDNEKRFKRFEGRLVGLFQHCSRRLIVLLPQMSSFIHLQRRHAPHRRERPLLAKEGTITKEFS